MPTRSSFPIPMDPKLEAMLTELIVRFDRISTPNKQHGPRLVPNAPILTLIARPIETIGDQSSFFVKGVLNEFSTETFILPEALELDSLPISIYIADPSLAEEYEKYENEMHEEDSYRIEVESQVEKTVIELSYKEEQIIDLIEATKSSYCGDNTIDHIEMIICHGRSEVNRFDLVKYTHAYSRFSKSSTLIDQCRQMVHETEWLATRAFNWCAILFVRYFWRTLWHLLGTTSLVTLTYSPHFYNQN
ncbi:hypothetical protein AXF42_Ash001748 [Apostasia shenzhenica]|uniref:Uncharacterized protein n=1 Tax=Apostasia shenzhenica TaxID=1088818 RepID=A0A2I0AB36_9ASPA|nr:hypothetical protein AXF42_Ash001748 [Apostasia shenzhenica]